MRHRHTMGRAYFETLYKSNPDPWNFSTSEYEDQKYQATLQALPRTRYAKAIEVGCSIGVLTARLATRCESLDAVDLSPTAIEQARIACAALDNVYFHVSAAPNGLPEGAFDLIILSEVLYYLDARDLLALAGWCRAHTNSSADIILCHWLGPTNYPLSGETAARLFVSALQPCLERHSILHQQVYRLERIRLGSKEAQ
ncbi:SAM-dependent methyltransferase [Labrys portucalensis]|uniref:SAM-dependent methyltransferase n=1 Tax=Labrys neptuniae TaxID=376174 RepID=A0ABV6ZQF9_9HYPH